MSNFDDLFEANGRPEMEEKNFDKDAWAEM